MPLMLDIREARCCETAMHRILHLEATTDMIYAVANYDTLNIRSCKISPYNPVGLMQSTLEFAIDFAPRMVDLVPGAGSP